ncbi:MAG TPA: ExeM/NucH family extracellular endonuclease [Polyangiales bacterium]
MFEKSSRAWLGTCAASGVFTLSLPIAHAAPQPLATPYAQTFDTLAASGTSATWTDDVTIPGWYASRTSYGVNNGASNAGALYSYGSGTSSERALGSLCSNSTGNVTYGVRLVNNTTETIAAVSVQYSGEQWRQGGGSTPSLAQKLDFQYKVSDASLAGGAFVDVDALDFTSPNIGATTASALDGNANAVTVSGSISGLALAPGQVLWLQWTDVNDTGNDHGLAIDDLAVAITSTGGGGGPGGDPCTEADTPIGTVQGSGAAAAVTGVVTVQGVVVGDYEGSSPALRGFYVQDTGDGNGGTSDAIFVFNADANSVSLGDEVQVTGTASEFQDQTQLSSVSSIELCGVGRSVTPTPVALPVPNPDFLERYEGMLVTFNQTLYVSELYQLGRFGQLTVSAGGRLPQPTHVVEPGAPAAAQLAQNDSARIIIDDALQSQNPDPIVFGRNGLPLGASNTLRGGDTVTGLTGVLTYTWAGNSASGNRWRVRPVNALGAPLPNFVAANPRPSAAPAVGGSLKVASFNLLNYFNTFGTTSCSYGLGGGVAECRGADSSTEFTRQANKTVAAMQALNADVLGVIEMENDGYGANSAIRDLVDRVNAVMGPDTYAFVDFDAATGVTNAGGTDAIKVGILYKPTVVTRVANGAFVDGDAIHNRNPLAQTFQDLNGQRFTVIVNHFKSKGCDGASGGDADQSDGQGCFNARRVAQANALVTFMNTVRNATGEPDLFVVGDLNAYAKEDPIDVLLAAGLLNLNLQFAGEGAYSYVFDGQWGYLDHALATASAAAQVQGALHFHINSDEPSVLDYNTDFKSAGQLTSLYAPDMYRTSDHDPLLIGVQLAGPAPVPASTGYLDVLLAILLAGCGGVVYRRARS